MLPAHELLSGLSQSCKRSSSDEGLFFSSERSDLCPSCLTWKPFGLWSRIPAWIGESTRLWSVIQPCWPASPRRSWKQLSKKRGSVKSALMDQSFLAGRGNVYADEILLAAGLHPRTKVQNLGRQDSVRLYEAMQSTISKAVRRGADPEHMPISCWRNAAKTARAPVAVDRWKRSPYPAALPIFVPIVRGKDSPQACPAKWNDLNGLFLRRPWLFPMKARRT